MTILTWEHLAKNQTESETIEEAIVRIVAQHEANPTSHMGTGEAIDMHRKNEVLDHKAGSVLVDKDSMTEFVFRDFFHTLDFYDKTGDVSISEQNEMILYIETGATSISKMMKTFTTPRPFLSSEKDFLFQILMQGDFSNNNFNLKFGIGFNYGEIGEFFGFEKVSGDLKAVVNDSISTVKSSTLNIDTNIAHIYRVQYIAGEKKFYFYIDGNLVYEYLNNSIYFSADGGPFARLQTAGTTDGRFIFMSLLCSRSVI